MKNRNYCLVIEIVLFLIALIIEIMYVLYATADSNNNKALNEWHSSSGGSKYIDKAIDYNGQNPAFYLNRAVMRFCSDKHVITVDSLLAGHTITVPDSVLWDLEKSVSLAYGEPLPVLNLAMAYAFNKEYDRAISVLMPLSEQKKCWPEISILCGLVFELAHNNDKAAQLYIKAIKESPIVLESAFYEALQLRNPEMAQYITGYAEKEIYDSFTLTNDPIEGAKLGELAFINGDIEKADSLIQWSLSALPYMDRAWLFLGRIYEKKQEPDFAENCYEKAAILDYNDPLPKYFLKNIQGKSSVLAEQMKDMISIQQKIDFRRRYNSAVLVETLLDDFDLYCTYDYVAKIKDSQKQSNLMVVKNVLNVLHVKQDIILSDFVSEIAHLLVGTPCEVGLLDVYPEQLRVFLDKTDRLRFIEECLSLSLTLKSMGEVFNDTVDLDLFLEELCQQIQALRYRDGVVNGFSDRIYYISEWLEQAEKMGYLEELTPEYGHEYVQQFSYLSDNMIYLPQVSKEPECGERILSIEKALMAKNPYYIIDPENIDKKLFDSLINGDIIAVCSDRKGEDIGIIGFVYAGLDGQKKLIFASTKEKVVIEKDLLDVIKGAKGIRLFRICNITKSN